MKKILTLIGALCSLLIFSASLAAPAEATSVDARRVTTCVNTSKSTTQSIQTPTSTNPGAPAYQNVSFETTVYYKDCTVTGGGSNYVLVQSVSFYADPPFTGCTVIPIQNFKHNMNAIGNWDPGEVTQTCTSGTGFYGTSRPNPSTTNYIYPYDPSNQRCFATRGQISLGSGYSDRSGLSASKCLI